MKVEDFELKNIESKSEYVQNLILNKIIELEKSQFAINNE